MTDVEDDRCKNDGRRPVRHPSFTAETEGKRDKDESQGKGKVSWGRRRER